MKKNLFLILSLSVGFFGNAQQDIFAITGKNATQIMFNDIRTLNQNLRSSDNVILNDQKLVQVYSQETQQLISQDKNNYDHAQAMNMAALAFDQNGNNLVYMPMSSSNIYVINAKTGKITLVENTAVKSSACHVETHFTRMCTGADGNIYALNNSGSQLIKISKNSGKYTINNVGNVTPENDNSDVKISTIQYGFGGDMIADANGDLLVFSASGNIFRVNTKNLKSTYMGKIAGLPNDYTLNGAAVNAKGKVLIASAKGQGFYEVDLQKMSAEPVENSLGVYVYDLASKYVLNEQKIAQGISVNGIDVYPTRIESDYFNVRIADPKIKGNVTMDLFNSAGAKISTKILKANIQENRITIDQAINGLYLVTLKDDSGKILLTKKLIIE